MPKEPTQYKFKPEKKLDRLGQYIKSFTPYSDNGRDLSRQSKDYKTRMEATKAKFSKEMRGVWELANLPGQEVPCQINWESKAPTPILFKAGEESFEIGTFYPASKSNPRFLTENLNAGTNFASQNMRGESNKTPKAVRNSISTIEELLKSNPEVVILPAFYPDPDLIDFITKNKNYHLVYTNLRVTKTEIGQELLGNATLYRSDINLKKPNFPYWFQMLVRYLFGTGNLVGLRELSRLTIQDHLSIVLRRQN